MSDMVFRAISTAAPPQGPPTRSGRLNSSPTGPRCSPAASDRQRLVQLLHLSPAEAVLNVVVDQSARLHERVADGRPHEPEAAPLQVLAHRS